MLQPFSRKYKSILLRAESAPIANQWVQLHSICMYLDILTWCRNHEPICARKIQSLYLLIMGYNAHTNYFPHKCCFRIDQDKNFTWIFEVSGIDNHLCVDAFTSVIDTLSIHANGLKFLPWVYKQMLVCTITHGHLWTRI